MGGIELTHTAADEALVEAQLGRPTRGRWAVAKRCHLGVPMVIENHPRLDDETPFPTLFWLTCPVLVKRASALESSGELSELTERLGAEPSLRRRLGGAIARYRNRRDAYEKLDIDAKAPPGGGPERVKCLHAHLGHHLADPPNPIGALGLARAGWPDCVEPCYRVP
ncbi:MAG: DUF501 domain-containing protein [Actinomycetota bacterium]